MLFFEELSFFLLCRSTFNTLKFASLFHQNSIITLQEKQIFFSLKQWFPTGVPRHTRGPWVGVRGTANSYNSLIFIHIKPARGAAKYLHYYVRVLRFNSIKVGKHCSKGFSDAAAKKQSNEKLRSFSFRLMTTFLNYFWLLSLYLTLSI